MPDDWSLLEERIQEILKRAEPWVPTFTKILTALVVPASLLYLLPTFLGLFAAPLTARDAAARRIVLLYIAFSSIPGQERSRPCRVM